MMMDSARSRTFTVTLVMLFSALVGCSSETAPTNSAKLTDTPKSVSRSHSTSEFKARANDLQEDMSTAEVEWLLGQPSTTQKRTLGQKSTHGAWAALTWDYRSGGETLEINFSSQKDLEGEWRINDWEWLER